MKIIWEPKDIVEGIIACKDPEGNPCEGWWCKWALKVCYEGGRIKKDTVKLVAIFSDGLVTREKTREEVAEYFTAERLVQARAEWITEAISWARTTNGVRH